MTLPPVPDCSCLPAGRDLRVRRRSVACLLLTLALGTSSGVAQQSFYPPSAIPLAPNTPGLEDAHWPADFAGGHDFSRVQAVDLNLDGTLEGLVLNGSYLIWIPNFDAQAVLISATADGAALDDVVDFTVIDSPGLGQAVALTTSTEAMLLRMTGPGAFTTDTAFGQPAGWAGVTQLEVADVDGNGTDDLFGLQPGSSMVITQAQSPVDTWSTGPTFTTPSETAAFTPVAWDNPATDPTLEVAAVTTTGLTVHDDEGNTLYNRVAPLAPGALTRLRGAAGQTDRIAWAGVMAATGNATLAVFDTFSGQYFALGQRTPASLLSGDPDGDGDDDLVITFSDDFQILVLEQVPEVTFDLASSAQWVDTTPGLTTPGIDGNRARTSWADVTGDGIQDLLIPCPGRGSIVTAYGPLLSSPQALTEGGDRFVIPGSTAVCLADDGSLKVTFDVYYENLMGLGADGWRRIVWHQPRGGAAPDGQALSTCSTTAEDSLGQPDHRQTIHLPPDPTWTGPVTVNHWDGDVRVFHLWVEPVWTMGNSDPSDDVTRGPPVLASLTFDTLAMLSLPLVDDFSPSLYDNLFACASPGASTGGTPIGGFYHVKRFPTLIDDIPTLSDLCLTQE